MRFIFSFLFVLGVSFPVFGQNSITYRRTCDNAVERCDIIAEFRALGQVLYERVILKISVPGDIFSQQENEPDFSVHFELDTADLQQRIPITVAQICTTVGINLYGTTCDEDDKCQEAWLVAKPYPFYLQIIVPLANQQEAKDQVERWIEMSGVQRYYSTYGWYGPADVEGRDGSDEYIITFFYSAGSSWPAGFNEPGFDVRYMFNTPFSDLFKVGTVEIKPSKVTAIIPCEYQ